ncbi:hypothetical protein ACFL6T_05510 [Candidatus Zixiibacteriota bacterium]
MMIESDPISRLEARLNDFNPVVRAEALARLIDHARDGLIMPGELPPSANMHCHTFYSYNAAGLSPSSVAWTAWTLGIDYMGIVDFDVLDGVEEFLAACEILGVKGSTGIETRAFIPEYSDRVINSPGEPGVCYLMGVGFISASVPADVESLFHDLRDRTASRNRSLVERLNNRLDPVVIDYEADVLSLTPSGNPTERHIVSAYASKAEERVPDTVAFWSEKLRLEMHEIGTASTGDQHFLDILRQGLIKQNGIGYEQPDLDTFPHFRDFFRFVESCGAIPCAAWLDGTSEGEQVMGDLLELLIDHGAAALSLIPERSWNITDPTERDMKSEHLKQVVELCRDLDLPLIIGTEMSSFGQIMADDLDAPTLAPFREEFLQGARFLYGHTLLQQSNGRGWQSDWMREQYRERDKRVRYITSIGAGEERS